MKRILSFALALILLCSILPGGAMAAETGEHVRVEEVYDLSRDPAEESASAQKEEQKTPENYLLGEIAADDGKKDPPTRAVSSGTCGNDLSWHLDTETGVLTVSGTGAMTDFATASDAPWYGKRAYIKSITVEEGVTCIGKRAFFGCQKLKAVTLPQSVTEVRSFSFQTCSALESIIFSEGLTTIGYAAFNMCTALASVTLPASLSTLDTVAFYGCTALVDIRLAEGSESFAILDGCLYNADITRLLLCPANLTGHLVIPDTVTYVTEQALVHCMGLEAVTIPDSMKWDPNAFTFCTGMQNYYVYESNPNYACVEGVLFNKAKDTLVLFPVGRTGHYDIPEGTVTVDYAAFCRMEKPITIGMPDSVTVIKGSAFSYSPGLTQLTLSSKLEEIYAHAFTGCTNMENVTLPDTLTLLGYNSFYECKAITEITIPDGIYSIASNTFENCTALKKVVLPSGLTGIASYAFSGCRALETVDLPETLVTIGNHAFYNCDALVQIRIPEGVEEIPMGVFYSCDLLKTVVLPKGLEELGAVAFYSTSLEHVVIPETVTKIGNGAFSGIRGNLTSVHFLGAAPVLGGSAFSRYSGEEVTLYYMEGASGWTSPTWNDLPTALWSYDYSTTANCTAGGVETFQCKDCDLRYERNVRAYGHSYGQWSLGSAPTQSGEGFWQRTCSICGYVQKESIPPITPGEQAPAVTNNFADQNYSTWGSTVKSYLFENADGTLTRVEPDGTGVSVERYGADFTFISRQVLEMELPLFGGFYEGRDYFFLVFGQTNPNEDDSVEVVRVVRYSKDWYRMGQASLYGANTYIPFDAGSLRMTQYEDMLYVHTSHEMYAGSDGLHHQANMIFSIYVPEMEITDQFTDVMNVSYGYVSHSFNQFIITDGQRLLTLNHGDAYPRSAVIVQYAKPAGQEEFTGQCSYTSILKFTGSVGYNATGASLGAFERSASALLTAGNSILQDGSVKFGGQRNIFLAVTPLGDIGTTDTTLRWITNYDDGVGISVSTPHLLRIRDDYFILMWTENSELRYVFVNGLGETVSEIYRANMPLSDCKPIVYGGKVCWYVTQNSKPAFFTICIDDPEQTQIYASPVPLTLDPNGGTLESTTVYVNYGQPYGQLPVPARKSAYQFKGWHTVIQYFYDRDYSAYLVTEDMIVDTLTGKKLYAHWEKQSHTCEYEVVEVIPANCTTGEITRYECKYCDSGYRSYDNNYQHSWDEGTVTTDPTCTQGGVKTFACTLCEATKTERIPATGHTYTEKVTAPTCMERGYTTHSCHCGYSYTDSYTSALGHDWTEGSVTTAPSCTQPGVRTVPCSRCDATKTESVPATGHTYTEKVTAPTCMERGYTTHSCHCGHSYTDSYVTALGHDWAEGSVTTAPTCTQPGVRTIPCSRCDATKTESVPATGHTYTHKVTAPTCTEEGYTVHTCHCGHSYTDSYVTALGHGWDEGTVTREPTETEVGQILYTCVRCGETKTENIPELGHVHSYTETVTAPTCTEKGFTTYTCSCGSSYTDSYTAALGHDWDEGTVTREPTEEEPGEKLYTCTRCAETMTESVPATGTKPNEPCDGGADCPSRGYRDVDPAQWYHAGIDYALNNSLMNGTGGGKFEPDSPMTRAMLVTVLWRYAGSPDEGLSDFTDVKADQWYAKAVAWAARKGVVTGVGSGRFDPEGKITREQMAAILYRYSNSLGLDTSKVAALVTYPDGGKVSAYATDALSWAVAEGLITGSQMGSKVYLDPQGNATRAQVATILMRYIENVVK